MASSTLTFDILARDKASPTLSKVGKNVEGLSAKTVAFGAFVGGAALTGVVALGKLGASAVTMGVKTAAGLEQAQVGFTTLLGSSQKAQQFLGDLSKFAAATPFEMPGLIDSSRLLLGVGVDAKKVIPVLTAFGDAAGAVGVGQAAFQRIILATSQAISAGRFNIQDLNQITENGIPIWKILSEALKKPVPVLRDMASKGKLLAKDVLPVLQKQMEKDYGGAMAKQSKTLAGVWSTLMDTLNIGLANVIKPLVPWLTKVVPAAAGVLSSGLAGSAKAVEVFMTALSGNSSPGEFQGVLKRVNRAGIITREVFNKTSRAIRIFWNAFANRSKVHQFGGAMKSVNDAGLIARTVYDAARDMIGRFAKQIQDTIGFLQRHQGILKVTTGIVLGLVAVTKAYNVALAVQSAGGVAKWLWGAAKAWRAVQLATETATAVQWAYNAALAFFEGATGIGLVLVAIGALTAAFVYLWTTNEGFRRVVIKSWHAIIDAIGGAVDWITGTAWPALTSAWDGIVAGAVSLWHWMVRAWDGITGAVSDGVAAVVSVASSIGSGFMSVVGFFVAAGVAIGDALSPVGTVIMWLWHNILEPFVQAVAVLMQIMERFIEIGFKTFEILGIIAGRALLFLWHQAQDAFTGIGNLATWLYSNALKPTFAAIGTVIAAVGGLFVWLWHSVGEPAMHGIAVAVQAAGSALIWLWRTVGVPVFNALGAAFSFMWNKAIHPALSAFEGGFRALGSGIKYVWDKVIAPALGALKDFVQNRIAPAFKAGVKAIGEAWDALKEAAKAPIRFVVNTVINRGIIGTFNKVADYFGVGKVDEVHLPKGFAKGGIFNEPTAIVGEGGPAPEYVIPTDRKHRKRAVALYEQLGAKLMAEGGILGGVRNAASSAAGWLTDPIGHLRGALAPVMDKLHSIEGTAWGRLVAGVPHKAAAALSAMLNRLSGGLLGSGGGSFGMAKIGARSIGQALAARYGWTGGQWRALDELWTGESGWNPAAKNPTSTAFGIPQFLKSTAGAYGLAYGDTNPAHQISAGLKYIRDVYGSPALALGAWLSRSPHWYDNGGTITEPILGTGMRTGRSYGFGGHGLETVIPGRAGASGETHYHLHNHAVIGSQRELEDWLIRTLGTAWNRGRLKVKVA